jgi:Tfp pilus assembly protein PilN
MRAVNLLPRELIQERGTLPKPVPLAGAVAVPAIALVLVVVGYSHAHSTVASERAQLAAAQAAAAAAAAADHAAAVSATAESGLAAQRTQRLAALKAVLAKQVPWDVSLGQLARALPRNVWLSSLTAISPTPESSVAPTAATGAASSTTSFTMNGYGRTEQDVALTLQHLQLLPSLTDVTLGQTAQSTIGTATVVQFTITATLQPVSTPAGTRP